jgi:hypothetical protein
LKGYVGGLILSMLSGRHDVRNDTQDLFQG